MSFFPETLARTRRKEAFSTRIALLGERTLGLAGAFENEPNRKLPEPRKKQTDDPWGEGTSIPGESAPCVHLADYSIPALSVSSQGLMSLP